jgi:hypothetical protein
LATGGEEEVQLIFSTILKQAMLTSLLYIAFALTFQLFLILLARIYGAVGIQNKSSAGMAVIFGVIWFLSFHLAWRILRPSS